MTVRADEHARWPNFIIIGAGRSGTTSLHYYLGQHPEVFVSPIKETNFFAFDPDAVDAQEPDGSDSSWLRSVRTPEEYRALFAEGRNAKAVGEASPIYLYASGASGRIRTAIPEARIIAILRNPVERAFSGYLKYVRDGTESRSFAQAIEEEGAGRNPESQRGNWHYVRMGYYARHLKPYMEAFPADQIGIFLYDELERDIEGTLSRIFRFLKVDQSFVPDYSIRYNSAGVPKSRLLHRFLSTSPVSRWAKKVLVQPDRMHWVAPILRFQSRNLEKPKLSTEVRTKMTELYRDDLSELEQLIGRDLSHWLAT